MTEHGSAERIEILPVTGLPEFRPGDDLTAALADAAPWLADGDVVEGPAGAGRVAVDQQLEAGRHEVTSTLPG